MTADDIFRRFEELGVLITNNHFVYASGRHGSAYVNKDALYPHTAAVRELCQSLAGAFVGHGIEAVAGPTVGGVILATWTAYLLSQAELRDVLACYAEERVGADGHKERYFGRGYDQLIRDRRVLIVEDVLNTGGSVKLVVDAVVRAGGTPVAVRALCNRGAVAAEDVGGVSVSALVDLALESWPADACPLCRRGVPVSPLVGKGARS
ncbi:MAG: phosphoribosyltransferase [Deltaproteobacteria bacterium]|nr:phosphoribosyltransferase [Deltaproteobacteria bacterium]